MAADKLTALASAAGVSATWLATGRGSPYEGNGVAVDEYPSRELVARQLAVYFPPPVIEVLRATKYDNGRPDPGPLWWSQHAHWLLSAYQSGTGPFAR